MLSVRFICVGRLKESAYEALCAEYAKRLGAFCRPQIIEIPEEAAREAEAAKIRRAIPAGSAVCALCVEGETLSSEGFSGWIASASLRTSRLCFVIGGSEGLDEKIKREADKGDLNSRILLRSTQDAIHAHRLSRFMVPGFLAKRFAKSEARNMAACQMINAVPAASVAPVKKIKAAKVKPVKVKRIKPIKVKKEKGKKK